MNEVSSQTSSEPDRGVDDESENAGFLGKLMSARIVQSGWGSIALFMVAVGCMFVGWGLVGPQRPYLGMRPAGCPRLPIAAGYAGTVERFGDYVNSTVHGPACTITTLTGLRWGLLWAGLGSVLAGVLVALLLRAWWGRAWVTGPYRRAAAVWIVPLIAAGCNVVFYVIFATTVWIAHPQGGTSIKVGWFAARVMPMVAWPTLLFGGLSVVMVLLTALAYLNRRDLDPRQSKPTIRPAGKAEGLGVACSGGGIRAGAVALGVLGALEQHDPQGVELPKPPYEPGGAPSTQEPLDTTKSVLHRVRYLSSVSGGGYTAGAYRISRPTSAQAMQWQWGVIGAPGWYKDEPPTEYDSTTTASEPTLYRHLQARRQFLRTGRGGLPASLAVAFGSLLVHLAVLLATLVVIAWPLGRLARTWPVYGGVACSQVSAGTSTQPPVFNEHFCALIDPPPAAATAGSTPKAPATNPCKSADATLAHTGARTECFLNSSGRQMPLHWGLVAPSALLIALGLVVFAAKLFKWHTISRHRFSVASEVLGGAGIFFAFLLLGVPLALDIVYPRVSHLQGLVALLTSLGAGSGIASRYITSRLKKAAGTLGTVLVAGAAVIVGTIIAGNAALRHGVFAFPGQGYGVYCAVVALLAGAYMWLNPQTWSLNTLYRNRIRGAFGPTRQQALAPKRLQRLRYLPSGVPEDPAKRIYPLRRSDEPTIASYPATSTDPKNGPVHLICCSAAQRGRTATGIPALSFVISSEGVSLYTLRYNSAEVESEEYHATPGQFVTAVEARRKATGPTTRWGERRIQAYGTETAAMAASAAAVASAMGRDNHRYPVAALALLNLRLGVWLPNPRYLAGQTDPHFTYPRPRLAYLLKEITGYWRPEDDHHVYVTDGGHRENLGLVELLRRRCKTIISIDASGDAPGTFTTLRQAIDLARIETCAVIDATPLDNLSTTVRPPNAHTILPVTYTDSGDTATIIHIRAVIYEALSASLIAFSAQDSMFPHYSTGNQFLTDVQFDNLVDYGRQAMITAIADQETRDALSRAL